MKEGVSKKPGVSVRVALSPDGINFCINIYITNPWILVLANHLFCRPDYLALVAILVSKSATLQLNVILKVESDDSEEVAHKWGRKLAFILYAYTSGNLIQCFIAKRGALPYSHELCLEFPRSKRWTALSRSQSRRIHNQSFYEQLT